MSKAVPERENQERPLPQMPDIARYSAGRPGPCTPSARAVR